MSEPAINPPEERPQVTVAPLAPENVEEAWPQIEPLLATIPGMGERYGTEDIKPELVSGEMQAWGIFEAGTDTLRAVFCTEIVRWPRAKILRIPYIAGDGLWDWIGLLPAFEAWASEQGFDGIELQGRPGWERVTGYRERFRTFVKDLSHG